jgi:Putative Actinobacterial Holin-X, holin superfamily III
VSPGRNGAEKNIGEIVSDVSEKASLLVREEIELAKAEITSKVKKLGRGAAVGVAAGVFIFFAFVMFLHALAWLLTDAFDMEIWAGYAMVMLLLLLLGLFAGLIAARLLSRGAPPTPDMAIEEAKLTRATLEHQGVERAQLEQTKESDKAAKENS